MAAATSTAHEVQSTGHTEVVGLDSQRTALCDQAITAINAMEEHRSDEAAAVGRVEDILSVKTRELPRQTTKAKKRASIMLDLEEQEADLKRIRLLKQLRDLDDEE